MTEKLSNGARRRERQAYRIAEDSLDTLSGVIYGVETIPERVPITASDRLARAFGSEVIDTNIELFRDVLVLFTPREQQDLLLYFSGFPTKALYNLGSDRMAQSLTTMRSKLGELGYPSEDEPDTASLDARFAESPYVKRVGVNHGIGAVAFRGSGGVPSYDMDRNWQRDAACAREDPEMFEENEDLDVIEQAQSICLRCEVMYECLVWALAHEENDGTLGSLSSRERKEIGHLHRRKMISVLSGRPIDEDGSRLRN